MDSQTRKSRVIKDRRLAQQKGKPYQTGSGKNAAGKTASKNVVSVPTNEGI